MPVGIPKTYKPCARCGEAHHAFARCADGVLLRKNSAPPFGSPERKARDEAKAANIPPQPEAEAVPAPADVAPPPQPSDAEQIRVDMRAMAESYPEGSKQRAAIEAMLARDEARTQHADDERALRERTGNPEAHLPLPNIIREKDEKKGRQLEAELARVLAEANQAQDPRARPPREEVMLTKEILASIPAKRDAEESAAREAAKAPEHVNGDTVWICENRLGECHGHSFRAAAMDVVRRKAAAEPTWKFVCPTCKGPRVRLSELQEQVA